MAESFREIERDADEYTVSSDSSDATTSVGGIGALSGKAIQSLGEATLRAAENLITKGKIRTIESTLKRDPANWPLSVMADLLELQRVGFVYPENVRRAAWDNILLVLEKRGWQPLTEALKSWDENYATEKLWFIQQLAVCKLSGWTSHPVRERIFRPRDPIFEPTKQSVVRSEALSESFSRIILFMLEKDAAIIHRAFNLDSFARILADDVSHETGPHVALSLFFNTFASLHPFPDIPPARSLVDTLPKILANYPAADCMVQYLCTSDTEQHESNYTTVINHVLCAIRPFATRTPQREKTQVVLRMHPYLKSPNIVNPTWPFLCFSVLLAWQSADATHMFICQDMIQTLENLVKPFHEQPMCLLYLSLLTTMAVHQDLSHCALKNNLEGWIAGKPRRKSSATSERRPSSSGSHSRGSNASIAPMPQSEPSLAPVPAFPANQRLELETSPRDSRSSRYRHLLADALAFAHRAVELDSRMRARDAVDAYVQSAGLLVEAIRLTSVDGRVSRSAIRMKEFYDAYVARIKFLCDARHIHVPDIERAPPISMPAPPTASILYPTADVYGKPVPKLSADARQVDTLRVRNDELLALWQSDMDPD